MLHPGRLKNIGVGFDVEYEMRVCLCKVKPQVCNAELFNEVQRTGHWGNTEAPNHQCAQA
jgi:hypothetical protein